MSSSTEIDEELQLLCDSAATFVQRSDIPARLRGLHGSPVGFSREAWREIAENGWLGIAAPEELGGLNLGMRPLAAVLEELGRGPVPEPVAATGLALAVLAGAENGELKNDLAPRVIGGEMIPALAWQEEAGDEEGERLETQAAAEGSKYRLNGVKRFVPSAIGADGFIVSAQVESGVGLFWVEKDQGGLSIETLPLADGSHWGTLTLKDVAINKTAMLAESAAAVTLLAAAREEARLAASAELFGVMNQAFTMTLEYLRQRKQFDRPIGSFQALQHRCVDLFIQIELAKSSLDHALTVFSETGEAMDRACAASNAKARCSEAALKVTQKAIQLHGAIGYTEECNLGLYVKRALVLSTWLGNAAYHRRRYALLAPDTMES
jgi:alkylation response protein AidB-like acyl-CoA dehydrogenase